MSSMHACLLIAEIGDNFPESGRRLTWSDLWPYGIAIVVAVIATLVVSRIRERNDMSVRCDSPEKLFRELCQAHKLNRTSARLLAQLAAAWQFEQPAQVFLMPSLFETRRLPASLRNRGGELARLQGRIFAR